MEDKMNNLILDEFKSKFNTELLLKNMGFDYDIRGDEAWMRCPFHDEVTPSFHIRILDGTYYCFGCSAKGGDLLAFIMSYKTLGFIQAIEMIASILEIEIPKGLEDIDKSSVLKRKLIHVRSGLVSSSVKIDYTNVYAFMLKRADLYLASDYLTSRGIKNSIKVADKLGIRAIKNIEEYTSMLRSKFSDETLISAGVMSERKNLLFGLHKLLIPFIEGDRIHYVSARAMSEGIEPRYKNLRDISIPGLYNVDSTIEAECVFLCEGLTDTIAMTGIGIPAVGIAGAGNINIDTLSVLNDKKVIIAFDNDKAGQEGLNKLKVVLKYISSEVHEFVKPEKDILEHLVASGEDSIRTLYKKISDGDQNG